MWLKVLILMLSILITGFSVAETSNAASTAPPSDSVLSWCDCLKLALQYNPDVQNAMARVEDVEGVIITRRSNFLPTVNTGGVTTPSMVSIGIQVPIYSKAMRPTFDAFPYARQAAWANVKLSLMEMAYQLRLAYIEAYYAQEMVPVARKELQLLNDRLQRAPSLFQAGRMSKADLESLQVRKALAESKVETALETEDASRLTLFQITGLPASDNRLTGKLITDFQAYVTLERDPQKLVEKALAQRQDLEILKNLKKVNQDIVLVNAAALYPEVGATASFSNTFQPPNVVAPVYHELSPHSYNNHFDQQNFRRASNTYAMTVNWRVYDGGSTEASKTISNTDVLRQDILIQQITDEIPRQVDLALEVINGTEKIISNLQTNGSAEKSLKALEEAFGAGRVSQVEILDAQDEFTLYQEDQLRLKSGHDQALAALDRIVGETFRVDTTIP